MQYVDKNDNTITYDIYGEKYNVIRSTKKKSRINFDKLTKELEVLNKPTTSQNSSKDERFWRPELDKSGNGLCCNQIFSSSRG